MRYSKNFERDWAWYLKNRNNFTFSGQSDLFKREVVIYKDGTEMNRMSYSNYVTAFPKLGIGTQGRYQIVLKAEPMVVFDRNGVDGIEAFYNIDTLGKVTPTRHPCLLERLLRVKASVNFQIKQWAQGRADGTLPAIEFSLEGLDNYLNINWKERDYRALEAATIEVELQLPEWVIKAVEHQKLNYY